MHMKEPQYNSQLDLVKQKGNSKLGLMINEVWDIDPRRMAFVLSRYKFVSKMLEGNRNVLEVGCGDAFASRIVKQTVENLTVSDFDPVFIQDAKNRSDEKWELNYLIHDMIEKPANNKYNAIYALDVLEHINPKKENIFIRNICLSLKLDGITIFGVPSLESQSYASPISKAGHVNCKSGDELTKIMKKYFRNVFLFSMNDEVVHTGYSKMAHYLLVLCCGAMVK